MGNEAFQTSNERKPIVTPRGVKLVALVTIVGAAGVLLTRQYGPAAHQAERLMAAREHASFLEPRIHGDPRFVDVSFGAYTGDGGCLWVKGVVLSIQHSNELRQIVESSHPPVPVNYSIYVQRTEL